MLVEQLELLDVVAADVGVVPCPIATILVLMQSVVQAAISVVEISFFIIPWLNEDRYRV